MLRDAGGLKKANDRVLSSRQQEVNNNDNDVCVKRSTLFLDDHELNASTPQF